MSRIQEAFARVIKINIKQRETVVRPHVPPPKLLNGFRPNLVLVIYTKHYYSNFVYGAPVNYSSCFT